jgi:phage shock protein PspC (stress-responsive transcriptional regulator)
MERAPRVYRRRRSEGGVLLGLCAGIGAHLGLDPIIVRLLLVLLLLLPPAGLAVIIIYLLFALFVPYEPATGDRRSD